MSPTGPTNVKEFKRDYVGVWGMFGAGSLLTCTLKLK